MNEDELKDMLIAMIKAPPQNEEDYVRLANAIIMVVQAWTMLNLERNDKT